MRFNEVQLPVVEIHNESNSQYIGDVFQELQSCGFRYFSFGLNQLEHNTPDDELIEAHRELIERLMIEDNYENIEVIKLKNYSPTTGACVYKSVRDTFETRLITHGQCSLFVNINNKIFEFQCRKGDVVRLPADLLYWLEVGVYACRYIHLYMTEDGWDKPSDKQNIEPFLKPVTRLQAN